MKRINILLALCVTLLVAACLVSVCRPVRFNNEVEKREKAVKKQLLRIRQAEECYRQIHGTYTASWTDLINETQLPAQCQYIPYADTITFQLQVSNDVALSGQPLPLVQCEAHCSTYLNGLNEKDIQQYIHRKETQGQYPGLKFGDINKHNDNATNW